MTCSFQACTVGMQEYHQLANLIHCFVSLNEGIMPGRKFRLSVHRKNEERKKWKPKRMVKISVKHYQRSPSLVVSIPLSSLPEPDGYNVSLPVPVLMRNIDVVLHLITFLDACKLCHGNSNENMIVYYHIQES